MPPRFCMTFLRFTIGTALLLAHTPKVGANQPNPFHNSSDCQTETLPRKASLKQTGKLCKTPEPASSEDSDESSTKASTDTSINDAEDNLDNSNEDGAVDNTTGLESNSLDGDSSNLETDNNSDQNIPDNSAEQSDPQSTQQDSHNINFSLDLNLGGGSTAPPDNGTEAIPPEPEQSEPPSVNPSQNAPTSSEGLAPQELISPNPKLEEKKLRTNKAEQLKKKQRIKEENRKKRDRPSHRKPSKGLSDEDSKPYLKPGKHKNVQNEERHPKQNREKAHFGDKSHEDKAKGVKSRNHSSGKALRRSLDKSSLPRRPKSDRKGKRILKHSSQQSYPKSRHRSSDFQRQRSQSHPSKNRLRRSVSPTKVLRSPSRRISHPNRKQVRH
jgi:hypothetical protein